LARTLIHIAFALAAVVLLRAADAQTLAPYKIVGDSIAESLTGSPGDATRGRALVLDRSTTCILCHSGPFETPFQGDLAPPLAGVGNRWKPSQLRLRLVRPKYFNPDTVMPSYYQTGGFTRVGRNWEGKSILTADQIEDIVAYLITLKD
jgi:L-cysteine S-thiosulfotransferase